MNKLAFIIVLTALVANAEVYNVTSDPTNLCPTKKVTRANGRLACTDGKVFIEGGQGGLLAPNHKSSPKPLVKFATDWNARIGWYISHGDTLMVVDLTTETQRLQQRFNESNEVECIIPEPEMGKVPPLKSWVPCNKYAESDPYPRSKCLKHEAYFQAREKHIIACQDPKNQRYPKHDPGLDPMPKADFEKEIKRVLGNKPRELK